MQMWGERMKIMFRCFCTLILLGILAGCAVNPVTGRNELALMQVSPEQEVELGKKSFAQAMQSMGGIYPDASINAYVDRVGQRVSRRSHRPEIKYSFKVIHSCSP